MKALFYLHVIPLLIVCGCAKAADSVAFTDGNDIKTVSSGNAEFAFDVYNKLRNDPNATAPKENLFFSPYSLSTALAMTYAGARGETQKQMEITLHLPFTNKRLHSAAGALQQQLIQKDKSRGYQILLANTLWGQKGEPILKEFLDLTNTYYGADFTLLDFVNETEKSRQTINLWVEEKTSNKIKDLIPPGGVDGETVLVLTNAVYFKGEWSFKFKKSDTRQEDFNVSAKEKVKVDMMHIEEEFKYYEDEKLQAIELPYKGNEISMLVLLPSSIEGIGEVENTLTSESLNTLLAKMVKTEVDAYLPRFKIVWGTFSLNKTLIDLGMTDAFEYGKADFSGIRIDRRIWISNVFHQAFIEVNEQGTEAAAATAAVITKSIDITPVFFADHPFVFIIRDNHSGSILFMGRLINPSE